MGDLSWKILRIYTIFFVIFCRFDIVLIAGSRLEKAIHILGRGTIDYGHHETPSIVVEIVWVRYVAISRLLGVLERWCVSIIDENLIGGQGQYCVPTRWIVGRILMSERCR